MRSLYATAAILILVGFSASAQDRSKAILDELNAAPRPAAQQDLDTVALASAHRERSASMEERTNGLYQSWLVSICQGCGADKHKYSAKDADDLVKRARAQIKPAQPNRIATRPGSAGTAPVAKLGVGRAVYVDLSATNLNQIRRMPGR